VCRRQCSVPRELAVCFDSACHARIPASVLDAPAATHLRIHTLWYVGKRLVPTASLRIPSAQL
jgi:hypothetical protein